MPAASRTLLPQSTSPKERCAAIAIITAVACLVLSGCTDDDVAGTGGVTDVPSSATVNDTSAEQATAIYFTDITGETGIDAVAHNGEAGNYRAILETLGAGVAAVDYDGDRIPDLLFPEGGDLKDEQIIGTHLRTFRNRPDGSFEETTDVVAANHETLFSHGLISSDFNEDGWQDFLVTGYGGLLLYQNQGDGTFLEVSRATGVTQNLWSTGAAWGDFDGDGDNDLYVARYVDWSFENNPQCEGFGQQPDVCSPGDFTAYADLIFQNLGDGTFGEWTLPVQQHDPGKGLAVLAGDLDLDADVDLYVANDATPNFLLQNRDGRRFDEIGIASGTAFGTRATADGSMGLELADLTLNGRPDIWVTNFEHQSFALYRNDAAGVFQHASDRLGISAVGTVYVGFGTVAADFDLDGDEDLAVANGHVMLHSRNSPMMQQPLLLENLQGRQFRNRATEAGGYFAGTHRARGMATADLDRDGDADLVVTHNNAAAAILRNDSVKKGRSLSVRLIGTQAPRTPVGTTATLRTASGSQVRFVKSGVSFLSSSEDVLSFTLPADGEQTADLEVQWVNGDMHTVRGLKSGRYDVVQSPAGLRVYPTVE